jgi:Domain of unknown function (DUF4349)
VTMLDDDRLAALLARAGATYEVPDSGPDDILTRATGAVAESYSTEDEALEPGAADGRDTPTAQHRHPRQRFTSFARAHRLLSAAACVAVVLAAAASITVLVQRPSGPRVTAGLGPTPRHPATSIPRSLGAEGSLQQHPPAAQSPANAASGAAGQGSPDVTTPTAPQLPNDAVGQSARIEQTGTLGLTVGRGDLNKTMTRLGTLATANGGFVQNSQTQAGAGSSGPPSGSITLQVPVTTFSAVLKQAQSMGTTSGLSTKATDVTGQYVDLQARITALEDSRQQYLTILSKATTVGDVLSVQEQIDTIQSQIEQLQGQLEVLTNETSYSTLSVTLSESTPPPRPPPLPESGLVRAWHDSIGGFVAGVEGVIRLAGPVLFAGLCLVALLLGGRALWRRYRRHNL